MSKQNQQPAIPANAQFPMEISVRIHSVRTGGTVLANASVDLNGCFAIRGVALGESREVTHPRKRGWVDRAAFPRFQIRNRYAGLQFDGK